MDTSIIDSFKENIFQKTRNPFLATVIIVWTFKNWRLVYALFNFKESQDLSYRIAYIESYYSGVNFYSNLFDCVWYAFIVLVITYLLLGASRLIVNTYEKVITPLLYKWTDKSSIVLKSDFINLQNENIKLEAKLDGERDRRVSAESARESLETRVSEYSKDKVKLQLLEVSHETLTQKHTQIEVELNSLIALKEEHESLQTKHDKLKDTYEKLRSENHTLQLLEGQNENLKNQINKLKAENFELTKFKDITYSTGSINNHNDLQNPILKTLRNEYVANTVDPNKTISQLSEDERVNFIAIGKLISNSEAIFRSTESVREYVSLDLIKYQKPIPNSNTHGFYEFTPLGRAVFKQLLINEEKLKIN